MPPTPVSIADTNRTTCRKVQQDGYAETPSRRVTRSRTSATPDVKLEALADEDSSARRRSQTPDVSGAKLRKHASEGKSNGVINEQEKDTPVEANGHVSSDKNKEPTKQHFEFGGSLGVSAMMIGFPSLMYYMWIGATYYDGHLPLPEEGQAIPDFLRHLVGLVCTGAFPSLKAWAIYWGFFVFEGLCYLFLPGIYAKGRPLDHLNGKQLTYYCSGVASLYTTIVVALTLHTTGVFKLYTIMDEFGPIMSVAIITGFSISIIAYFSAFIRGVQHRMTGYPIYDFFMGAELNPRLFGWLDFKMFFEVRLPWYILLLLSMGAAARQYEVYGYVSGEVGFLVLAHFLYANACSKGEECIIPTW